MGGRLHLRRDVGRHRVRGVRDRRVLPQNRRLAGQHVERNRSCTRCHRHGIAGSTLPPPAWCRQAGSPFRRGKRYTSFRFTHHLLDAGIDASIGTAGDALDNALAESTIGLYKTELIKPQGPWHNINEVDVATQAWVEWYNNRRLHGACGGRRGQATGRVRGSVRAGRPDQSGRLRLNRRVSTEPGAVHSDRTRGSCATIRASVVLPKPPAVGARNCARSP